VYIVIIKTEGQTIYRKPQRKVTKLQLKFYLFCGQLNLTLNNPAQELRFQAGLNLYIRLFAFDFHEMTADKAGDRKANYLSSVTCQLSFFSSRVVSECPSNNDFQLFLNL